ncbi:hypothetical protein LSH36_453g02044 [Paralvinella palmiformis]|uniref:Phosphatidylinositol-specific phospholipase C X domain-containing protein n=1 Tax=Paralvinella palmiformis TaxID=53620 RepID=A0AAD9MZG7_9ANNE|nr:hypothetical protein LSH36_453g02044 [Paralvinella palmiformis]
MDVDPLFIRNPDPNMTGDDPLFVVNPKYLQPANVSQVHQPMPMYYEQTERPLPPPQQTAPSSMYALPGQPMLNRGTPQTDWMSSMPDEAPLAAFSIPGTHNSLALAGGPSVQSQTWDVAKQLKSGIRYLDVNLCLNGNEIVSRGDPQSPSTSIHELMAAVTGFLTEHSREAVLIRITDACSGGLNFYIRLHQTLNEFYAKFVLPLQIQNPKMGMARGKIVIMKDYYGGPPGGLEYNSLDKTEAMTLASPDEKDLKPLTKEMKRHMKKVMSCGDFEKMFLTMTSASGPGFTFQYAAAINEVLSFFLHKNPKGRLGIVAMDFPPEHVINDIIARNFKRSK